MSCRTAISVRPVEIPSYLKHGKTVAQQQADLHGSPSFTIGCLSCQGYDDVICLGAMHHIFTQNVSCSLP